MSEEIQENSVEIIDIKEFSRMNKDLVKVPYYFVDYLLNGKISGTLKMRKEDYHKERILELALLDQASKHPDKGEVIHG
jgi:hypothetical protein